MISMRQALFRHAHLGCRFSKSIFPAHSVVYTLRGLRRFINWLMSTRDKEELSN
jgi:hypothetical protein